MNRLIATVAMIVAPLALAACDLSPKTVTQNGFRGTGMNQIHDKVKGPATAVPPPPYESPPVEGERARDAYENVQVLGDVSAEQFNYTMAALTEWVAPEQGCNYCHNPENMASDELYTKVVARRMLQMTINLNKNWRNHVGQTGVTCYTCHRGKPVPTEHWTMPAPGKSGIIGNRHGQNNPVAATAYTSLPEHALSMYLTGDPKKDHSIRVVSTGMHPSPANGANIMDTENSYAMMLHASQALGVNCTFCHNAQSFQNWSISTPQRATAWYGIHMARDINGQYIGPLANVLPANRKGPEGDAFKVSCSTCHQGQNKPLGGAPMAKDYPTLLGVTAGPPVVAATTATPLDAAPAAAATVSN